MKRLLKMGNSSRKQAAKCNFLSKEEQALVYSAFRFISKNSDKIKEDDLTKLWGPQTDPNLLQYVTTYLFEKDQRSQGVSLPVFAELFVYCTRGTVDEKFRVLMKSLGKSENENAEISYALVNEYVESIVATYMKIQKLHNGKQFKSWFSRGAFVTPQNSQRLAEVLSKELSGSEIVLRKNLEAWLQTSTLLGQLLSSVFEHLYRSSQKPAPLAVNEKNPGQLNNSDEEEAIVVEKERSERSLLPLCRGMELIPSYPSILDLNQIVFVNSNLPQEYQLEWRFLFSSHIHGESFSTLIGRIVNQGPTVLLVEDKDGHVFGGFAPENWALNPRHFGNDSCFLFSLAPKMRTFSSTGYNQHFQYLNLHQQTLPNGLAIGGQHGYCGLWLDSDYGHGHSSESCSTFSNYQQLSATKEFSYRHLEVWGVGEPPEIIEKERDTNNQSNKLESKALLKMSGRTMHSEAFEEGPAILQ